MASCTRTRRCAHCKHRRAHCNRRRALANAVVHIAHIVIALANAGHALANAGGGKPAHAVTASCVGETALRGSQRVAT
eukprot:364729-Chlamydomonas_euryale.AAC.2